MKQTLVTILSMVVVLCFVVSASAAPAINVDCNKRGSISATLAHLTQTGRTRGITISVSGIFLAAEAADSDNGISMAHRGHGGMQSSPALLADVVPPLAHGGTNLWVGRQPVCQAT